MKTYSQYIVFIVLLVLIQTSAIYPQETIEVNTIIQEAVEEYVSATGNKIIGMGSWVNGNYRNPLEWGVHGSDHDMRLLLKDASPKRLANEWKKAQDFLRVRIKEKLSSKIPADKADEILDLVNLYPPDQLMDTVGNTATDKEIISHFHQLEGKPNLGNGPVEGLFGDSSKAFKQRYEQSAGRTFFRNSKGKVVKGYTDLDHMMEGWGKFTIENTSHLSEQFAKKAALALEQGNAAEALKHLQRLDEYLKISKKKARLSSTTNLEVEEVVSDAFKRLDAAGVSRNSDLARDVLKSWMDENNELIKKGLNYAKEDAAFCRLVAKTNNPYYRKFLRTLSGDKMRRFKLFVNKAFKQSAALGAKIPWGKALKGAVAIGVALEIYGVYSEWQEGGAQAALDQGSLALILTVFPANVVGQLVLEYGKDVGYDLVTRYQDCEDLVGGIYSVKGREHLSAGTQIADLARKYIYETDITPVVALHARRAADKQLQNASRADQLSANEVEERLVSQCAGPVIQAWKRERYVLLGNALQDKMRLDQVLASSMLLLSASVQKSLDPQDNGDSHVIKLKCGFSERRIDILHIIKNLEKHIKDLGGVEKLGLLLVKEHYVWKKDGNVISDEQNTVNLLSERPAILGFGHDLTLKVLKSDRGVVELEYYLNIVPNRDLFIAPEVEEFLLDLSGRYVFKAVFPLESLLSYRVLIEGPTEVLQGKEISLEAVMHSGETLSSDVQTEYDWINTANNTVIAKDQKIGLKGKEPGEHTLKVILYLVYPDGRREPLAAAFKVINVIASARLILTSIDRESGQKVAAHWRVEGPMKYIPLTTTKVLHIEPMFPGQYRLNVTLDGYESYEEVFNIEGGQNDQKTVSLLPIKESSESGFTGLEDTVLSYGDKIVFQCRGQASYGNQNQIVCSGTGVLKIKLKKDGTAVGTFLLDFVPNHDGTLSGNLVCASRGETLTVILGGRYADGKFEMGSYYKDQNITLQGRYDNEHMSGTLSGNVNGREGIEPWYHVYSGKATAGFILMWYDVKDFSIRRRPGLAVMDPSEMK
ncbi:MAG: hypothetical protein Q8Q33_05100 [Chlamydiota bacterium]|nr:hypothetical protein [Chlamydiota bacterium]